MTQVHFRESPHVQVCDQASCRDACPSGGQWPALVLSVPAKEPKTFNGVPGFRLPDEIESKRYLYTGASHQLVGIGTDRRIYYLFEFSICISRMMQPVPRKSHLIMRPAAYPEAPLAYRGILPFRNSASPSWSRGECARIIHMRVIDRTSRETSVTLSRTRGRCLTGDGDGINDRRKDRGGGWTDMTFPGTF